MRLLWLPRCISRRARSVAGVDRCGFDLAFLSTSLQIVRTSSWTASIIDPVSEKCFVLRCADNAAMGFWWNVLEVCLSQCFLSLVLTRWRFQRGHADEKKQDSSAAAVAAESRTIAHAEAKISDAKTASEAKSESKAAAAPAASSERKSVSHDDPEAALTIALTAAAGGDSASPPSAARKLSAPSADAGGSGSPLSPAGSSTPSSGARKLSLTVDVERKVHAASISDYVLPLSPGGAGLSSSIAFALSAVTHVVPHFDVAARAFFACAGGCKAVRPLRDLIVLDQLDAPDLSTMLVAADGDPAHASPAVIASSPALPSPHTPARASSGSLSASSPAAAAAAAASPSSSSPSMSSRRSPSIGAMPSPLVLSGRPASLSLSASSAPAAPARLLSPTMCVDCLRANALRLIEIDSKQDSKGPY